jgi:hypothetical protein
MIAPAAAARLKAGVIAAVSICGGVDGAGATVDKSRQLAGKWHNQNDDAMPRVDDAFMLDQVAVLQGQRPPILSAYAADLGHVVIRLPDSAGGVDALSVALIDASAEFGDIATELREATRDHEICKRDRRKIVSQIDEAIEALARMRAIAAEDE